MTDSWLHLTKNNCNKIMLKLKKITLIILGSKDLLHSLIIIKIHTKELSNIMAKDLYLKYFP